MDMIYDFDIDDGIAPDLHSKRQWKEFASSRDYLVGYYSYSTTRFPESLIRAVMTSICFSEREIDEDERGR
jgi:hypothetical protein